MFKCGAGITQHSPTVMAFETLLLLAITAPLEEAEDAGLHIGYHPWHENYYGRHLCQY